MKKLTTVALCAIAIATSATENANIPNPLLPNVADIGVMKHNGKYYLGGCRTDGDFYISSDLVNWSAPIHVIDMDNEWIKGSGCDNNQIHANDMMYHNGTVHAYWSVNYWGRDRHAVHVVHSEATDPMGPYEEPVKDRWMDNRIDPKVFRDDNGDLYMYMVRFTDGNTIWARKMKNYREFDNEFLCQFASLPNTWERMDNAVAEGPWVMKYHGKYYMMYNANHTGGEWGNYQLGVAQADSPMGFNNGNKYSHPVVLSNQKALEDNYVDILRYGTGSYDPMFAYTTSTPPDSWNKPGFNDDAWQKGSGGFTGRHIKGSTTYRQGTIWNTPGIWLRKHFKATGSNRNYALRLTHNGDIRVYINGKQIYDRQGKGYNIVNLTKQQAKEIADGDNLIAVECFDSGKRGGYVNVELFDMADTTADPEIVWTPGQPNILRGPNGLEWWLIYMANDNASSRSQYIDRVHFFGDKMWVDGISHRNNQGFHPTPALPAYGDVFDTDIDLSKWNNLDTDAWKVTDGELRIVSGGYHEATLAPAMASPSYLWEANVKATDKSGTYAIYIDKHNYVKILFNRAGHSCDIEECIDGKRKLTSTPLYDDFRWNVYHQIRAERDGGDIAISIDEMRYPEIFTTQLNQPAVPGLFGADTATAFDGLTYTIGFDDGNDRMNNWDIASGALTPTARGAIASGNLKATKGMPSTRYEFTTQVSGLGNDAVAGIYPCYVDDKNYIAATLDSPRKCLTLTTVKKGKTVDTKEIPLDRMATHYSDMKFTDSYEKGYLFDEPVTFDAIWLKRYDVCNHNIFVDNRFDKETPTISGREVFIDNMFSLLDPAYLKADGSWGEIPTSNTSVASHPAYSEARFEPITARQLRFINRNPGDGGHHIYDIQVHELWKDSYNLRAVREGDSLHLLVDGREVATVPATKAPSVVGLLSTEGTPEFHGTLYYHK